MVLGALQCISITCIFNFLVNGEANFTMSATRLTIGGFTQPGVARNIIEMPSKSEKRLSLRLL